MTDRDIDIGRLQALTDSLRNQIADQFQRIDALEVDSARALERLHDLKERLDATKPETYRALPDMAYSWKLWAAAIALVGILAGAWSFQDIKAILLPVLV